MISSKLQRLFSVTLATLLVISSPHSGICVEREFAAHNCAVTPPEGWELITDLRSQPGLLAAFRKVDKTALFLLNVDEHNKPSGPIDDRFVSEFEHGVEGSGGRKRLSGSFIEVAGIRAYERIGRVLINGKDVSSIMRVIPGDGKFCVFAIRDG